MDSNTVQGSRNNDTRTRPAKLVAVASLLLFGYHAAVNGGLSYKPVATAVPIDSEEQGSASKQIATPAQKSTDSPGTASASNSSLPQDNPRQTGHRSVQMQDLMQLRWEQSIGGDRSDSFMDVVSRRSDLMTIAVGASMSHSSGRKDAWVVAIDSQGKRQWQRALGGARDDEAFAVTDLQDGSVVLVGISSSKGKGGASGLVARLDADGTPLWQTTVDTPQADSLNAITVLASGDLIVGGTAGKLSGLLARLDPQGKVIWQRTLASDAPDIIKSLLSLPNDDIIVVGERTDLFDSNAMVSRANSAGDILWHVALGGEGNDALLDAVQTASGELLAVGEMDHASKDKQGWMVKLSTAGEVLWEKTFGDNGRDGFRSILMLADQSLVVAGISDSATAAKHNSWILRVTEGGDVLRTKQLGTEHADGLNAISARSDGSFVAAGFSQAWHDEPRNGYIAMMGLPIVRSGQLTYNTNNPPVIFMPGAGKILTEKGTVEVLGNVIHNKPISQLFVDGRPARVLHSGAFTSRIPIPVGTTEIKVEAIDNQGAVGSAIVQVTRTRAGALSPQDLAPLMDEINFGNYHAIVIGNNDYPDDIPQLKTAVQDATALAALLKESYNFDVDLLLNADRQKILSVLEKKSSELREDDNLLVYYAGHGYYDEDVDLGYWLPVDADLDTKENWIRNSTITDSIKEMKAKHVLLVADSCFSGTLLRSVDVKRTGRFFEQMASRSARLVMTSGGIEPVLDGGGDGHSVFARSFLDKLNSGEQIIDGTSLFQAIREPVVMNSQQVPQYSNIRFIDSDGGDFLFVRRN